MSAPTMTLSPRISPRRLYVFLLVIAALSKVHAKGSTCEYNNEFLRDLSDRCGYIHCLSNGAGFTVRPRRCTDGYSVPPDFNGGKTNPCTEMDEECVEGGHDTRMSMEEEDSKKTHMKLTFDLGTETVQLNLTKSDHVTSVPIYVIGDDSHPQRWTGQASMPNFTMYTDMEKRASISVMETKTDKTNLKKTIRGTFMKDNQTYMIRPREGSHSEKAPEISAAPYRVFKVAVHNRSMVADGRENNESLYDENMANIARRERVFGFRHYAIETVVVSDYGLYQRYYKLSSGRTHRDRNNDAIFALNHHFAHVMNGVDMRYRSIRDGSVAFNIRVTGIIIAQNQRDSYWSDRHREPDRIREYVEADRTLDELILWVERNRGFLPPFDQATGVTGYTMYRGYSRVTGRRRHILGLADYDSVCTKKGVSLNEDLGEQSTALTIAHEMGHNLGARHDGNGNNCRGKDQYVMASSPGTLNGYNFQNVLRFSPCSIYRFRGYVMSLNMRDANCMLVNNGTVKPGPPATLPGQLYTPDQQCQRIYGKESYYCAGEPNDAQICLTMVCYNPRKGACFAYSDIRAATGTSCGDRKWCVKNECRYDSRAKPTTKQCLYGDFKGLLLGYNKTCDELIQEQPWMCYRKDVRPSCCTTCAMIKDSKNRDCPYGDRADWCRRLETYSCYTASTRRLCCKTCAERKRNVQGCEYGDRATRTCTDAAKYPWHCYDGGDKTCCETCAKLKGKTPGCEYGDKTGWCATVKRSTCYVNYRQCCKKCKDWETKIPDCKYGDRRDDCARNTNLNCDDPGQRRGCCLTCATRVGPRTTAPPSAPGVCPTGDKAYWCRTMPTRNCYVSESTCCSTCPARRRNIKGCEYGDRGEYCARIPPRDCYRQYYRDKCCDRCSRAKVGPAGCEYGDQEPSCSSDRCSDPSVRRRCCHTCAGYKDPTQPGAPPSGCDKDKASWCRTITSRDCYVSNSVCCRTCAAHYRPNKQGCEYGDHYSWCPRMTADRCYSPDISLYCCQTCQRFKTNDQNCMYGDRRSDCSRLDCSHSNVKRDCCKTCGGHVSSGCADLASWCKTAHPSICYHARDVKTCCATCRRKRVGPSGCEYGDRASWCRPASCNQNTNKATCCSTCR